MNGENRKEITVGIRLCRIIDAWGDGRGGGLKSFIKNIDPPLCIIFSTLDSGLMNEGIYILQLSGFAPVYKVYKWELT